MEARESRDLSLFGGEESHHVANDLCLPAKLADGLQSGRNCSATELVSALQACGKHVFLVSGGFHCLIAPIALQLNIPPENIYANRLKFYFTGEYAGFDENQPTSRSGGKAEVIEYLKKQKGFKNIVHIGDGSTDLEASPPADAFIGFGGNVIRESVKARAQWFVMNFDDLRRSL
ncbi:phosphoserine phosphatase [Lasius niger]|uniref:Phosphoserine phosphatase n=1 Tax=Lasius niger TaxID=67767 RepID=A0A0J7KHE1_LASNI|nr:phosphoserine phosphatase [Lasius niger]